jgi:hypothetical protein
MDFDENYFNVSVRLHSLFCFQGEDAGNFFSQTESEPYLWVMMFKLDGDTLRQEGDRLVGKPAYFLPQGSHGNLGVSGVVSRQTTNIPANLGTFSTSLRTLQLTFPNMPAVSVPGIIGCCVILLEENATPDGAAEVGHRKVIELLTTTLEDIITSIRIGGLGVDVLSQLKEQMKANLKREPTDAEVALAVLTHDGVDEAAASVLQQRLKPVERLFRSAAPGATAMEILKASNVFGALNPDSFYGQSLLIFTQPQLHKTFADGYEHERVRILEQYWNSPWWAWNIHGTAYAHRKLVRADLPSAKRLEVTCTGKRDTARGKRITEVGGIYDGSQWYMSRPEAAQAILDGKRTFFTRSRHGGETEVEAVKGGFNNGHAWYFLETQANRDPLDNLLNLPDCPPHDYWRLVYF